MPLCETCHGKVHGRDMLHHRRLTKMALAAKKARGERVGEVPFGYQVGQDGTRLEPNAAEQSTIAAVRELAGKGLSVRAIASELASRGVVGRSGNPLDKTQVHRISKNEAKAAGHGTGSSHKDKRVCMSRALFVST